MREKLPDEPNDFLNRSSRRPLGSEAAVHNPIASNDSGPVIFDLGEVLGHVLVMSPAGS